MATLPNRPLAQSSIGLNFQTPKGFDLTSVFGNNPVDLNIPQGTLPSSVPMNIMPYAQAATTGLSLIGDMVTNLEGREYKNMAADYNRQMANRSLWDSEGIRGLSTNDSIMSNYRYYGNESAPQIQKGTTGEAIGSSLGATASGAMAGMSFGPIGAAIGGGVGLLTNLIGQIGGNKQRKKAQERINNRNTQYNNLMAYNLNKQISDVDANNDKMAMANYFDLGGSMIPTLSGAIGYDLANKQLAIENLFALNSGINNNSITNSTSPNIFAHGGSIHINPANKGKFNATKERTGKTTEELTHSKNPLTRKRAIFAQNAARWNKHENGGNLFTVVPNSNGHGMILSNGVSEINAGGKHNENPFGGVFMGIDQNGTPNLVEEGEVKWNDYIFSNKLKLDIVDASNNNLPESFIDKTFADIAKLINNESEERPNDPISKTTLNDALTRLASAQEQEKEVANIAEMNSFADGGALNLLRAAPIIGSGLNVISDAFGVTNDRDYTNIDGIRDIPELQPIVPQRINNYMSYVPLDRDYYLNRQSAQTAATRDAVVNASNGNRGALMNTLAAIDYGGNIAEGALARQAQESDLNQKLQIADFNRSTDIFNTQLAAQADAQLLAAQRYNNQTRAQIDMAKAQMKDAVDARSAAGRSANLTNFLQNLSALGTEQMSMNMINNNPGLYYSIDKDGSITYKNGFDQLPKNQQEIIMASAKERAGNIKPRGERLNIKS
jgi:hypothetical protein